MALPQKIQINAITGSSLPSTIDNDINTLKQALVDLFAIPNNTNISNALATVSASGLDNIILRDTAADPNASGRLQRNVGILKYHNGSSVRTLMTLEDTQTIVANSLSFAAGAGVVIGTTDANSFGLKASGSTRLTIASGGVIMFGTSVSTGASSGDTVYVNGSGPRFLNAAGTTSNAFNIQSDGSDNLVFSVPTTAKTHNFNFAANAGLLLQFQNSGAGITIQAESSADHAAPPANAATLFIKDNGAGKTQLVVRFSSGATQVIATQP